MLNVEHNAIRRYARQADLGWSEDPTNAECRFDRNYLRHDVMPAMRDRWPDIAKRLQRSAVHASDAAELLSELAALDLARLDPQDPGRLPIDRLSELSASRQRNLIRFALRRLGLSTPTTAQLQLVISELVLARVDAQPQVRWPGTRVRRYRNGLYLLPENAAPTMNTGHFRKHTFDLGPGLGQLGLASGASAGLSEVLVANGLYVRVRSGGEEFRPIGQQHTRKLKNLLQEEGVVPWMRNRLPLVYSGERLVAVGDLWVAATAASQPGVALRWDDRPALH
jgi:tRNA(Ile)-lysidine synthase